MQGSNEYDLRNLQEMKEKMQQEFEDKLVEKDQEFKSEFSLFYHLFIGYSDSRLRRKPSCGRR